MTTITSGKRRRCPSGDSPNDSKEDNEEILTVNPQLTTKRRVSAAADFAAHRLIVSERRQLAVLKQLTASDETSLSPSSVIAQSRPTKVFRRNEHGETIVHIAARKGDLKRLRKALKDGANVNEEDNAGWTPLHEAVTKNQYRAANLLLKSGANVNAPGPEGQTPLIDAVLNNNIKIVGLLLNYSADASMVDQTRLNETMIQVLKREITNFDLSDTENDDQSLSPSSDESEGEDKNLSELSSFSCTSKLHSKKSFEYSSIHNPSSTTDNERTKKNPYDFESDNEHETIVEPKQSSTSNDSHGEQEQNYRVPPIRIILARTVLPNSESNTSSIMDEDSITDSSSLPIIEENEKFLSTIMTFSELNERVVTQEEEQKPNDKNQEKSLALLADKNNSSPSNLDSDRSPSPETIISSIMDNLLTQIEPNRNFLGEPDVMKREKQGDVKSTTRTLRSHARGKSNSSLNNSKSNDNRRIPNRRRILEKHPSLELHQKPPLRKKTISERGNNNEISNHSDDQTTENNPSKIFTLKTAIFNRIFPSNETNISDDGSNSVKPVHPHLDIDSLPPSKRQLCERNSVVLSSTEPSNSTEENVPVETTITRDIPPNGIKQFLEIRQQIDKRHETMLNGFVVPKIPKDFADTLMMKKTYLIAPAYKSLSITNPTSLGIQRLNPPIDLDLHLSDVFTRQEDERYRMRLSHQVEREKLILSHEQEILRLYGNATRSATNQEIPFSYCSLLKDNEVYNISSTQERPASLMTNDYTRGKHRWNGRSFLKWLDDSNLKYKRLSCDINQRQHLEANTLYSMQRMVWLKHIPKETSSSGRMNSLLSERYLPKVGINTNFWTHWEGSAI